MNNDTENNVSSPPNYQGSDLASGGEINQTSPSQNPPQTPPGGAPPSTPPQDSYYYPEEEGSSSPLKKIFIIGGIVIGALIMIIIIFAVILPMFGGKKNQNITLEWWGLWEDPAIYQSIINDFKRENPNITIKYERRADIKDGKYIDKLRTRIDNGNGPDILRFHNSWVTQLEKSLLPLPKDVVTTSEIETNYFPVIKSDLKRNGAYYGLPVVADALALFVNNSLFKASNEHPPANWNDLQNAAIHLTVTENGKIVTSGVALGTFDNITHASDIISLLMVQNGADFHKLSGPQRKNAEDALAFYTHFAKGTDKVWDDTMEDSRLAFAQGKLAMFFGYSWDIPLIKAAAPDLDFSIISVPYLPPRRNTTIASYWVEGVSARTKYPNEAFEFLKFLSKKSTLQKIHTLEAQSVRFGTPYPRSDMADLLKTDLYLSPFMHELANASSTPFSSDTYDDGMNASMNAYLGNAIRSILNDSTSVESSLDQLSQGVNLIYGKYEKPPEQ